MKACRDSIEALKNSIGMEEKKAYGSNWLQALGRGSPNTDCIAHQHGVVGTKSECSVASQADCEGGRQ